MRYYMALMLALLWGLASGCGLAIAPTLQGKAEDKIEQRLEVSSGGTLRMEVDRGSIEVRAGDERGVLVKVSRKATGRRSRAERLLKQHQVTITQDGNNVGVKSKLEGSLGRGWFWRSPRLDVRYEVAVPREYDVILQTAGGKVSVSGVSGDIRAKTAGGGMDFAEIQGPINGQTSGGGISVASCEGRVEIRTAGGGIRVREVSGDVQARTSGGSIHVEGIRGDALVETSGGGIEVKKVRGQLTAKTSGGSIHAVLEGQPAGEQILKTSGGSITVYLERNAAFDVDARTSGGRVSTELPVSTILKGEQKRNTLQGKINEGGTRLFAATSGGSIHLKLNE